VAALGEAAASSTARAGEPSPQAAANAAWQLATAWRRHAAAPAAASSRSSTIKSQSRPQEPNKKPCQEASNLAWRPAAVQHKGKALAHAAGAVCLPKLGSSSQEPTPQQLANLAWAPGSSSELREPVLERTACAAGQAAGDGHEDMRALATILWALSRLPCFDHAWTLLARVEARGLEATPEALGALLMECEQAGFVDSELSLLDRLARSRVPGLGERARAVAISRRLSELGSA
ncbi:unnamed protein product, partial [Polarella glacialis]